MTRGDVVLQVIKVRFLLSLLLVALFTSCGGGDGGGSSDNTGGALEFQDEDGKPVSVAGSTAKPVPVDTPYQATHTNGWHSYYIVKPSVTGLYNISVSGVVVSPSVIENESLVISVYHVGGGYLRGWWEDCGERTDCDVLLNKDEQYVLKVVQYGSTPENVFPVTNYTLLVENTQTDAVDISENTPVEDTLQPGEEKYYRITATRTGRYEISTSRIDSPNYDPAADIFLSGGRHIMECKSSDIVTGCFIQFIEGREYVLKTYVKSFESSTHEYSLIVSSPYQGQGTSDAPIVLSENVKLFSEVGAEDYSYFEFTPSVTAMYEFNLYDRSTGIFISSIDEVAGDGREICLSSVCRTWLEQGTTYVIDVYESSVNDTYGGTFSIHTVTVNESDGIFGAPDEVMAGEPITGVVAQGKSWYSVTVPNTGYYSFSLSNVLPAGTALNMQIGHSSFASFSVMADCNPDAGSTNIMCSVKLTEGVKYTIGVDDGNVGNTNTAYSLLVNFEYSAQDLATTAGQLFSLSSNIDTSSVTAFSWQQTAGPEVTLINPDAATAQFEAPVVVDPTILVFELTVTYSDGTQELVDELSVRINVPPGGDAGPNLSVAGGTEVTLSGEAFDLDGSVVTWLWVQTSGPTVTLQNPDTPTATFMAPVVSDTTALEFTFTVTDNDGESSAAATAIITVIKPLAISAPVFNGALLSGVTATIPVITDYSGEGQLVYTLDNGPATMSVNDRTGMLTWVPAATDEGASVPVTVTATDGVESASVTFNVDVATSTPVLTSVVDSTITIDEPGTLQGVSITLPTTTSTIETTSAASALVTASDLVVSTIPDAQGPQVPEGVTRLTDYFRVTSIKGDDGYLSVNIPEGLVPAGRNPFELKLYTLTNKVDHELVTSIVIATIIGSGIALNNNPDVLAPFSNGTIRIAMRELEGTVFLGYSTVPSVAPVPNGSYNVECLSFSEGGLTYEAYKLCNVVGDTRFDVLVKDFTSNQWTGRSAGSEVTVEELVSWVRDATLKLDALGITYSPHITIDFYNKPPGPDGSPEYGYVSFVDASSTVNLNSHAFPVDAMKAALVHEMFHHAHNVYGEILEINPLLTSVSSWPTNSPQWITEGLATWFEDEVSTEYDKANSYTSLVPNAKNKLLKAGVSAIPQPITSDLEQLTNPYSRFAWWKMLDRYCSSFDVKDIMIVTTAEALSYGLLRNDAGLGLERLNAVLPGWGCDFKNKVTGDYPFGPLVADSLVSALVNYQDITVHRDDILDLDPLVTGEAQPGNTKYAFDTDVKNDSLRSVFKYKSFRDIRDKVGSVDPDLSKPSSRTRKDKLIGPAGALSFKVEFDFTDTTLSGQDILLRFQTDKEIWIEIKDLSDGALLWSSKQAVSAGIKDIFYKTNYEEDGRIQTSAEVPNIFVTVVNPSLTENVTVSYGIGIPHLEALIVINQLQDDNFKLPASIQLSNPGPASSLYRGSNIGNGCGEMWDTFSNTVEEGAVFWPINTVEGFPGWLGGSAYLINPGCSSFIAVKDAGTDQEKVWISASQRVDWWNRGFYRQSEFQIQFYSGDPGNQAATRFLKGRYIFSGPGYPVESVELSDFTNFTVTGSKFIDYKYLTQPQPTP